MTTNSKQTPVRIGLGIVTPVDALAAWINGHQTTDVTECVPDGTDLCIVDEAGFERHRVAIEAWQAMQDPIFAPVLLLTDASTGDPYSEYAGDVPNPIDSIERLSASPAAISSRLENLLERRTVSQRLSAEYQLNNRVFETSPMAKVVLDTDGQIVRANQRAKEVLGVSQSGLESRTYNDPTWESVDENGEPFPDDELPFAQVMATDGPVYGVEHGIRREGGEQIWLSVNAAPIRDETGAIEYVITTIDDITERRAQERELERQLDLFERAQTIADIGAWEYDVRAGAGFWTDEVARIHGLDTDVEPSPELSLESFHPDDRPAIETAFERAVEDGESYDLELRLIDTQGEQRWVRTRGEPQYEDGELIRVRGTMQDITEQKERELTLQQMTHAVDEAPIGVSISDPSQPDNPLVYINEAFVELTGYDRDKTLGRNCRFLQGVDTDREAVDEIRQAIDAEKPVSVVLLNYRADGTSFWNSLEIAPVHDEDGTVSNWIGFQQDVTERTERQRQLELLDRYLRHNLRNKMNVVTSLAELIHQDGEPPLTEYADQIDETSTALLENAEKERKVTDVLRDSPTVRSIDLMGVLQSALEMLQPEYPGAAVSISGPPSVRVRATDRLPDALCELIRNGLAHNDSETPSVTVAVEATNGDVTVQIADDGPGIPAVEIDVLGGVREETDLYHGQGLGLWLVYLIVRRCGGNLSFETKNGDGTVVTVSLPVASDE